MKRNKTKYFISITISFLIFVIVAEIGIRFTGIYAQLNEKNGHDFLSLFKPTHHGYFQNYVPFDTVHVNNTEFSYVHAMDEYGFRNDSSFSKRGDVILALGDSFTEGLGASQDSTWPAFLQSKTKQPVYNAGVMGSDPVFGFKILTDNHFKFTPSKVIFVINYSDIADAIIRGGNERFLSNGTVKYRQEPWMMPIYKKSHLFRAMIHLVFRYDYMFNPPVNRDKNIGQALNILTKTLSDANNFCNNKNIKMYVFVHPVPQEYYRKLDSRLDFKKIDEIVPILQKQGIHASNLRPSFEMDLHSAEDWKSISWPIDGHFNGKGYNMMATFIAKEMNVDTSMVY